MWTWVLMSYILLAYAACVVWWLHRTYGFWTATPQHDVQCVSVKALCIPRDWSFLTHVTERDNVVDGVRIRAGDRVLSWTLPIAELWLFKRRKWHLLARLPETSSYGQFYVTHGLRYGHTQFVHGPRGLQLLWRHWLAPSPVVSGHTVFKLRTHVERDYALLTLV